MLNAEAHKHTSCERKQHFKSWKCLINSRNLIIFKWFLRLSQKLSRSAFPSWEIARKYFVRHSSNVKSVFLVGIKYSANLLGFLWFLTLLGIFRLIEFHVTGFQRWSWNTNRLWRIFLEKFFGTQVYRVHCRQEKMKSFQERWHMWDVAIQLRWRRLFESMNTQVMGLLSNWRLFIRMIYWNVSFSNIYVDDTNFSKQLIEEAVQCHWTLNTMKTGRANYLRFDVSNWNSFGKYICDIWIKFFEV